MSRKNIEIRTEPFRGAQEIEQGGKKYYVRSNLPVGDPKVTAIIDAYVESESARKLNDYRLRVKSW